MKKIVCCNDVFINISDEDSIWDASKVRPRLGEFVKQWLSEHGMSPEEYLKWERYDDVSNRTHPLLIQAIQAEAAQLPPHYLDYEEKFSNLVIMEFDDSMFDGKIEHVSTSKWNKHESGYEICTCEKLVLTPIKVKAHIASFVDANDLEGLFDYLIKTGYQALSSDTSTSSNESDKYNGSNGDYDDEYPYCEYCDECAEYDVAASSDNDGDEHYVPTKADIYEEMYEQLY